MNSGTGKQYISPGGLLINLFFFFHLLLVASHASELSPLLVNTTLFLVHGSLDLVGACILYPIIAYYRQIWIKHQRCYDKAISC